MPKYRAQDIFQDIPDDPDNILLTIPEDLINELDWSPGDRIKVSARDGLISLEKIQPQKDK